MWTKGFLPTREGRLFGHFIAERPDTERENEEELASAMCRVPSAGLVALDAHCSAAGRASLRRWTRLPPPLDAPPSARSAHRRRTGRRRWLAAGWPGEATRLPLGEFKIRFPGVGDGAPQPGLLIHCFAFTAGDKKLRESCFCAAKKQRKNQRFETVPAQCSKITRFI